VVGRGTPRAGHMVAQVARVNLVSLPDVCLSSMLLKNYFDGCRRRLIAPNLKSDSFSYTVPGRRFLKNRASLKIFLSG
jgi:hypothetical protein